MICILMLAGCSPKPAVCAACQRAECAGMGFNVTLATGKTVETCCPRCGAQVIREQSQPPRAVTATDYATGKSVAVAAAVFVVGSDVSHCAAPEVRRDAQGCCMFKAYDRCQPSTIAFGDRAEAETFLKQHGGKLAVWSDIVAR